MSRVALDLGVVQIYWYSICILVGMMVGMFVVYRETLRRRISDSLMTNLIFYTIIVSIIGARLYYVIFDWSYYSKNPLEIFEIWNGGLAIHGAIILGGLFVISYTKQHKMDTLKVLDICAVGLIIGQAIGRWGNFFNQEVYGTEVSLEFLKGLHLPGFIIDGMHINGAYHHPLFLYESLWCVLGFVILILVRRRKYNKTGQIFGLYCIWYSIGRFFFEGMRDSQYNLMLGSLKAAQVVSIGMLLVGLFFFLRRLKTSKFEYLYNDDDVLVEVTNDKEEKKQFISTRKTGFFGNSSKQNQPQPVRKEPSAPTIAQQPNMFQQQLQPQPQIQDNQNSLESNMMQTKQPVVNDSMNNTYNSVNNNINNN